MLQILYRKSETSDEIFRAVKIKIGVPVRSYVNDISVENDDDVDVLCENRQLRGALNLIFCRIFFVRYLTSE